MRVAGSSPAVCTISVLNYVNPKIQGERTEAKILARLLDRGYAVSVPFGTQRYDFIIDRDQSLLRVQCKTAHIKYGALHFNMHSYDHSRKLRRSYVGDVDVFVVFSHELNKFYWIPIASLSPRVQASLRLTEAKNGQKIGVRLASDFEF